MKVSSLGHADVIGIFVGIVGIVLAWVFYVRSKEQVRPCILIETSALVGKSERSFPESVEIRYNGSIIPELSKARITFWNAGKKTLDESDIARNDPITVRFSESKTQILDIRSMTMTRDVINAKATLINNVIYLSFDFLDKNDGLTLEAFHNSGSETRITLSGTIKGVRNGIAVRTSEDYVIRAGSYAPGNGFRAFGAIPLFISGLVVGKIVFSHWKINAPDIIVSVTLAVLGISSVIYGTYRYFRGRIPSILRRESNASESAKVDKQHQDLHRS